jgi:lysophospholipid acyltransferase
MRHFIGFDVDDSNDYSGAMMLATIKLTSFAFNVADGRTKDQTLLSSYNKRMKIDKCPSLLEFFGWIFFFGGFLVGPISEYMDYMRFVTMDMFNNKQVPSTIKPTLWLPLKSVFFIAVIVKVLPYYNSASIDTEAWKNISFLKKIIDLQLCTFTSRCKYYVAWFLSEGSLCFM